ncbi:MULTISPECIES: FecR domain-containing protein [Pseudanabaena]|jgi:hypothetical protein|uniref:FecR domain-containing protein n=1 Tax=Pseudanabaena TaxID=1152 RepID=UPI002479E9CB|nr:MULTISPECIES: FecR domain-containing protein [Pseudanabaena]MEA5486215.1 FecR domain-containing protein [Pseudanabaena sp. CCNP1317]WGS70588.1 FecR domain-containing protein [Pseudanabaena galeata CCNP1313]
MYLWNHLPNSIQGVVRQPHRKRLAFFLTGVCIFALAAPQIAPVSAQSTQATVQEILDGNQVFIQNKRASLKDVAKQKQQVRTGNSRTALLFNTGAVARLSANSVLNIGQCARLRKGTILINGAVNACSASITTGVRGTTYLLEVDESGNQQVTVLEGEVVVKRNAIPLIDEDDEPTTKPTTKPTTPSKPKPNIISPAIAPKVKQFTTPTVPTRPVLPTTNPQQGGQSVDPLNGKPANDKPTLKIEQDSQPADQSDEVVLKAGEKVEVSQEGTLGIIQQLTENEFVRLLQGNLFQGFTNQIPGIDKVRSVFNGLFPGANFPISIPRIPTPNIRIPRFPF